MAKFLSNIDLNGNELQNFVEQPLGTAPSTLLKTGRRYFDTSENRGKVYNGTSWLREAYMTDIENLSAENDELDERIAALEAYFSSSEDADDLINKWNEIVDYINGVENTTLNEILSNFASSDDLRVLDETLSDRMAQIEESVSSLPKSISVAQKLTSGTEIGSVIIDEVETKLYAPTPATTTGSINKYAAYKRGDGVTTTVPVYHQLNTKDIIVNVWRFKEASSLWEQVIVDVDIQDENSISITFASAPSSGDVFRIVIIS